MLDGVRGRRPLCSVGAVRLLDVSDEPPHLRERPLDHPDHGQGVPLLAASRLLGGDEAHGPEERHPLGGRFRAPFPRLRLGRPLQRDADPIEQHPSLARTAGA